MIDGIVSTLLKQIDPIAHLVTSYDNFLNVYLPSILEERIVYKSTNSTLIIDVSNIFVQKPSVDENNGTIQHIIPDECNLRNIDYQIKVLADVAIFECTQENVDVQMNVDDDDVDMTADMSDEEEDDDEEEEKHVAETPVNVKKKWFFNSIEILQLPCMVGCKLCLNPASDLRGMFLLNGEKIIVPQERMKNNTPITYSGSGRYDHCLEYRSAHFKIRSSSTMYLHSRHWEMVIYVPFLLGTCQVKIPVVAFLKLLGLENEDDVEKFIDLVMSFGCPDDKFEHYIRRFLYDEKFWTMSKDDVFNMYRAKCVPRDNDTITQTLNNEFLPHTKEKLKVLAFCVNSLAKVQCNYMTPEDRDSHISKRVETPGMTMAILLRQLYRAQMKETCKLLIRHITTDKPIQPTNIFGLKRIYNGIVHSIKTGNFSVRQASTSMQGISQSLSNFNSLAKISHLRRISTPRTLLSLEQLTA